jgi:hypothetical protein
MRSRLINFTFFFESRIISYWSSTELLETIFVVDACKCSVAVPVPPPSEFRPKPSELRRPACARTWKNDPPFASSPTPGRRLTVPEIQAPPPRLVPDRSLPGARASDAPRCRRDGGDDHRGLRLLRHRHLLAGAPRRALHADGPGLPQLRPPAPDALLLLLPPRRRLRVPPAPAPPPQAALRTPAPHGT